MMNENVSYVRICQRHTVKEGVAMTFHVTGQHNEGIDRRIDFFGVVWGGSVAMLGKDIEKVTAFDDVSVYLKRQEQRTIEKLKIERVEYHFYDDKALMRIVVETNASPFAMLEQKFWPVTSPYWRRGKLEIVIPPHSDSFLMTHRPTWQRWQRRMKQRKQMFR